MTYHKAKRFHIDSLKDARVWVWKQLSRRVGKASHESLHRAWWWDPMLLDDALASLRNDRLIQCISGVWAIRDTNISSARLPEPGPSGASGG